MANLIDMILAADIGESIRDGRTEGLAYLLSDFGLHAWFTTFLQAISGVILSDDMNFLYCTFLCILLHQEMKWQDFVSRVGHVTLSMPDRVIWSGSRLPESHVKYPWILRIFPSVTDDGYWIEKKESYGYSYSHRRQKPANEHITAGILSRWCYGEHNRGNRGWGKITATGSD